ncbi:MAG: Ig-like domain-containing protein, partial [bacterium]
MRHLRPVLLCLGVALWFIVPQRVQTFNVAKSGAAGITPRVAAGLVTPVNGGLLSATVVPIDTQVGYQMGPHVSGDLACYTDFNFVQVRYYRFSTGTNLVADDGQECSIDGNRIAYSQTAGNEHHIRLFDVTTSGSIELDHQPGVRRYETAFATPTVAFFDYFFTSPTVYTSTSLRVVDLSAPNQSQLLSSVGTIERNVKISPAGDVLVWATTDADGYGDITKAVRTNGVWTRQAVTTTPFVPDESPDTDGQYIVWHSNDSIYTQPVVGGPITQLDLPGVSVDVSISSGVIAFRHDNWDATQTTTLPGDVMIYVIATNTLYQLTNTPNVTEDHPDIEVMSNGQWRVVWDVFDATFSDPDIGGTTINAPNTTSTTISNLGSTPNPSFIGQFVTVSANVTGSAPLTGNVAFYDNAVQIGQASVIGGVSTLVYAGLGVGVHQITAAYLGDSNNQPSLPTLPRTHQVNPVQSSVALSSSKNPSLVGDVVTVTAAVSGASPTGTVTFFVGGVQSGPPATLASSTTAMQFSLPAGLYAITANYGGDANNLPAVTSQPLSQRVDVGQTSGTAVRAIVTGRTSPSGANFAGDSQPLGGFAVDSYTPSVFIQDVGSSYARGYLPNWVPNPGPFVSAYSSEEGIGAGGSRAIAYATYVNRSAQPVTAPADADLHGDFFGAGIGQASGAVYVFDRDEFLAMVTGSGQTLPQFMLGGTTQNVVGAWAIGDEPTLSLANLFNPSTLKAVAFQTASASTGSLVNTTLHANFTVGAGQAVIIVFDLTVYTPTQSAANFSSTLMPAPGFLKDPAGNPLPLEAVGLTSTAPATVANLALTPGATTSQLANPVTVTATATTLSGARVPNTQVFLEIAAGPNAQPIGPAVTNTNGEV